MNPALYEELRRHVRDVRRKAGFTQQELADKLGHPQSYVSKIESGSRSLDVIEFMLWLEACHSPLVPCFAELSIAIMAIKRSTKRPRKA